MYRLHLTNPYNPCNKPIPLFTALHNYVTSYIGPRFWNCVSEDNKDTLKHNNFKLKHICLSWPSSPVLIWQNTFQEDLFRSD